MTGIAADLLRRVAELRPWECALVFDELYDSLAGHDELHRLTDQLEKRGLLAMEPDLGEIERRLTEALEVPAPREWKTAEEALAEIRHELDERRRERATEREVRRDPRIAGAAGDLVAEALALSPAERGWLAYEILETIEPVQGPRAPDDRPV